MQPAIHKIIRKDKISKGKAPVMLQVYYNSQRKQISTGLKIEVKYWDSLNQCAVNKMPNAAWFNQMLKNQYNDLEQKYFKQALEGGINLETKEKIKVVAFKEYGYKLFDDQKNKSSQDYIRRCKYVINDFVRFAGNININAITIHMLHEYETHLFERGISRNTVNRMFRKIKQIMTNAVLTKVIDRSPFEYFKAVTYQQPKRDFLAMEEIDKIAAVQLPAALDNIRNYFLLCCFTGLRYSDAAKFNKQKFITVNKGIERIIIGTTKTGEIVSIKLGARVRQIIENITGKLPSNTHTNKYLKIVCEAAGIIRPVNWHMSRHAFAVNSASLGIPIEVVGRLLGHNSIKTTAIYYRLTDTKIDEYMDRWD